MTCDCCEGEAPLREVDFHLIIGAVYADHRHSKKGRMCSGCIHTTFWTYTSISLLLGWWSFSSLLLTPLIVGLNLFNYSVVFLFAPLPVDPVQRALNGDLVAQLEPYRDEMFQRILKGEGMGLVIEDIGKRVGASPEEVRTFYTNSFSSNH